ncbi:ankyrin repeat domain-containing protein [Nannocystis exedens]|nr:ankyrin repeat domain-containing protein [Nannocystis exedens]
MADHWEFVDAWFADSDPEPDRRPEPPRAPKDASAALARWEKEYGEAFEDCLQAHFAGGLAHPSRSFMEYTLLELPQAYDRWSGLNDLVDQGVFKEAKPRALAEDQDSIRFVWWSRGFIPVAEDGGGNLMCADLDPGPGGTRGQIIKWEKTEGPLGPLAENIGAYLVDYRNSLEDGSLAFDESGFLERRKVRKKGSKTQEELFAAVEAGDAATVSRLLAADKTLLEVRNQYDEPLIIPAMQKKHTEVVRAFLDAGVDANTRGPSGSRILDYALSAQAAGTVALLLERGAIPLLDGKYGAPESIIASMLSSATFSDHAPEADYLSMLESLLRAGADPNVAWYGETPLMKAAQFGSMALVKRLLAAGASVDAVDDKGKTAAGHARSRRRKEVAAFLDSLAAR